jgi:hypothetical protein
MLIALSASIRLVCKWMAVVSLLGYRNNYDSKKIYGVGPWCSLNFIKKEKTGFKLGPAL